MKESIKRLRDATWEAMKARQYRYDELMSEYGSYALDPTSDAMFVLHQKVSEQINTEIYAIEKSPEDPAIMSCESYIDSDGNLYK